MSQWSSKALVGVAAMVHRLVRGAMCEIQGDGTEGVPLILRSILEAVISIDYIYQDVTLQEQRAMACFLNADRETIKVNRKMRTLLQNDPTMILSQVTTIANLDKRITALETHIDNLITSHGITLAKDWPTIEVRAQRSGHYADYAVVYWWWSQDVHSSMNSLTRYLVRDGSSTDIDLTTSTDEIRLQLSELIRHYHHVLDLMHQHMGIATPPPLSP